MDKKIREPIEPFEFWTILAACGFLVILGGIFAGKPNIISMARSDYRTDEFGCYESTDIKGLRDQP